VGAAALRLGASQQLFRDGRQHDQSSVLAQSLGAMASRVTRDRTGAVPLEKCYQQVDAQTLLDALTEPRKVREAGQGS